MDICGGIESGGDDQRAEVVAGKVLKVLQRQQRKVAGLAKEA